MTNFEKYKTAEERVKAFEDWWNIRGGCGNCVLLNKANCALYWLDLEAEEEKPLPCPYCGSNTVITSHDTVCHVNKYCIECTECSYRSEKKFQKEGAIAAHNRVAKAVMEAKKEIEVKYGDCL